MEALLAHSVLINLAHPLLNIISLWFRTLLQYWLGGWPCVIWAGAVRQCLMWHVTW